MKNEDSFHESSLKEIITKIAMKKANMNDLYDNELEKRILTVIKERKSKVYQIKHTKDLLDFL